MDASVKHKGSPNPIIQKKLSATLTLLQARLELEESDFSSFTVSFSDLYDTGIQADEVKEIFIRLQALGAFKGFIVHQKIISCRYIDFDSVTLARKNLLDLTGGKLHYSSDTGLTRYQGESRTYKRKNSRPRRLLSYMHEAKGMKVKAEHLIEFAQFKSVADIQGTLSYIRRDLKVENAKDFPIVEEESGVWIWTE